MNRAAAAITLAALGASAAAVPAAAAADEIDTYPAAQCAAFWIGYGAYLGTAEGPRAQAFRDVAHRQNPGRAAAVDQFILDQIDPMILLAEQYIHAGDPASARLFTNLIETCGDFAVTQPETRAFR